MVIIGVAGNTGAGKSTISTIIKNNSGAKVIDADIIVKELMTPGEKYYDEVVNLFGDEILVKCGKKQGKVDSSKLAKRIYADDEKRAKLNKLTFKYVGQKTKEIILENKDTNFIVLDFPLLYEGGFDKICNYVIGVFANDETKIKRISERDKISEKQALARLNTQINEDELKEKVDFVIENHKGTAYYMIVKDVIKIMHKIKKEENIEDKK